MVRSIGLYFILGLALAMFAVSVSAQTTPSLSTQNLHSAFAFGDTWGVGNSLQFLTCADASCVQQRNFTLDSSANGYAGMYIDMQTPADGKPFLTYAVFYAPSQYELRSLKCGNKLCSQGNVIQVIANNVSRERTKVQFQPGTNFPAWVYGDYTSNTSYFVQCLNDDCSQRVQNAIGNTTTQQITNQWIFSADGTPMIATLTGTLVKCTDALCANTPIEIKSSNTRAYQSNAVRIILPADGKPVITYMNAAQNVNYIDFFIVKCLDKRCNKRATTLIGNWLKPVWAEHEHDLMIGADGLPAVSYQNGASPQVNFLHCSTSDCTTFTTHTIAPNVNSMTGRHNTTLIGPDGMPIVAYYNMQDLYYVHCSDLACSNPAQNNVSIIRGSAGNHVSSARV